MELNKSFESTEVRDEIDRSDLASFPFHLVAMMFPLPDEMFLAIVFFEERHDFVGREGTEIGSAEETAMDRESENPAGEIAIEHFTFPSGNHVANAAHALGVPEDFPGDAEFGRIKIG